MLVENSFSQYPVRVVVVMGVSGCGKTTIGKQLACALDDAPFIDADTLHPPQNIEKMANGIALSDSDRWPWLRRVHEEFDTQASQLLKARGTKHLEQPLYVVCGCSALKRSYRELLSRSNSEVSDVNRIYDTLFAFIDVGRQELLRRVAQRPNHFFDPALLDTQLSTLEPPDTAREAAIIVDGDRAADRVVEDACYQIRKYRASVLQ
ncbi:hypothetical protein IWW55_000722 [Coemansia sp. RSA 2706]|nr:hypothetical protein IWW55_000722 [Coemansia sp. RSA 2706]KAJ2329277.1 hypothetical protein IWW51_000701 [Coemansia sp. RSA 2702]